MADQLKACPFCGGDAHIQQEDYPETWWVGCEKNVCVSTDTHVHLEEAIAAWNTRAEPVGVPTVQAGDLYVEVRECDSCGHIGINDSPDDKSACNTCGWTGDYQVEDHCPGCAATGTMTSACAECGEKTRLIADTKLAAPSQPVAGNGEAVKWPALPNGFIDLVKKLVFMARTTGGTAGRDDELCSVLDAIEPRLEAVLDPEWQAGAGKREQYIQELEVTVDRLSCNKHGEALQRIGTALGLPAGSDLHTDCVTAIKALLTTANAGKDATPGYTTGHCENNKQPGGCQQHNLHCGWPKCDQKEIK